MEEEKFIKAMKIVNELDDLKSQTKSLSGGHWDDVSIELKTGYYDMGHALKKNATFKGEIGERIGDAVRDIIAQRIEHLEKEFKEL